MGLHREHIVGYDNFCKFFEKFDSKGKIVHVYFSGSKLENGESWCDDCIRAWPVIEGVLKKLEGSNDEAKKAEIKPKEGENEPTESVAKANNDSYFIYVEVGDRPTWKDPKSSFRTDKRTKLMVLPSILRWDGHQRLTGDQCENADLIEMLFTDEDD